MTNVAILIVCMMKRCCKTIVHVIKSSWLLNLVLRIRQFGNRTQQRSVINQQVHFLKLVLHIRWGGGGGES
jgi:hypothetical protein